jgi:lipopolysaccharide transport system permease protein
MDRYPVPGIDYKTPGCKGRNSPFGIIFQNMETAGRPVHIHIEPIHGWSAFHLQEIWAYRELLYFLIWRDIKVRYKQTLLGAAWAILQPVFTMIVFSIFFGKLAGVSSDGFPYPIFSYTALLPWQLFAFALMEAGNSLVNNQRIITKIYFPRLLLPLASVLAGLVDFAIAFLVLLVMMFYYHVTPTIRVLALPIFLLFALVTALAVGLWLSAFNVQYRDVRYVIPFLTQFWLFITPIAYPSSLIPEWIRPLYGLNPMAGVVEGFRWALLGEKTGIGSLILVSVVVVFALLLGGLAYFQRMEQTFADVV